MDRYTAHVPSDEIVFTAEENALAREVESLALALLSERLIMRPEYSS